MFLKHFLIFLPYSIINTFIFADYVLELLCIYSFIYMIPGSQGLNTHELAHRWVKDLVTRPDISIKSRFYLQKRLFTITDYNQTTHNIQFIT